MVSPRFRSGCTKNFAPIADVNMTWPKPSKLLNISQVKVGRLLVFGFGHLGETKVGLSIGRRVLSELPKRYPTLYPPFQEATVGTWNCLASHGPRITLLQSPNAVRAQHLGPWTLRTMRGVIQGYVDGKRKEIPGTLQDIYPDCEEAIDAPLAPLDTAKQLREGLHSAVDAGAEEGIQAGLLRPDRTAVVMIHHDPMRHPGEVDVPPWQPGHIESFNGVVTCFKKGFLSGVRGAHIAIGSGWPGYERGEPVPLKPELIPQLWSQRREYDEDIVDKAVYETQHRLVKLQERWGLPLKKDVDTLWQPAITEEQQRKADELAEKRRAHLIKSKEEALQQLEDAIKLSQDLVLELRQARKSILGGRAKRVAALNAKDPEELALVTRQVLQETRIEWSAERSRIETKIRKESRKEIRLMKLLKTIDRTFAGPKTSGRTEDKVLALQKHRYTTAERLVRSLAKELDEELGESGEAGSMSFLRGYLNEKNDTEDTKTDNEVQDGLGEDWDREMKSWQDEVAKGRATG